MVGDRYRYFRVEARDILDQLGQGVLELEKGAPAAETVAPLLRLAHTLKGAARVVRQQEIADCAHALEDALALARDASHPVAREGIDRILALVDEIERHVALLAVRPATLPAGQATEQFEDPLLAFRPAMDDLDALLGGVFEAHVQLSALRPRVADVERTRRLATLIADQLGRAQVPDARAGGPATQDNVRSMAEDLRGMCDTLERELTSNVDQLDRELRDVRVGAERLRLTPASALFGLLERAVRDVAKALGKRVVFEPLGGQVRVDTFVLNVVQRALLHIVRNAVAHGIEAGAKERRASGKPEEGRVTLRVSQRGRLVSFACTDDGHGIDLDAVLRIAKRNGLAVADDATMAPDDVLRLLLKGGISTSARVTDVSGRGIGLDVVREAAEQLGGEATARTEAGKGTTIELVVPVSVASFQALVVEAAGVIMAIPVEAVRRAVRLTPDDIMRTGPRESILFEGEAIPLASLPHAVSPTRASLASSSSATAVVVLGRSGIAAFTVDRVIGATQVVMRPLPEFASASASAAVAGATLDDVGDPLLILDPDGLVAEARESTGALPDVAPPRSCILVVDDSLTTRMLEQSILESAGYDVDVAISGEEALAKARTSRYALFLVDVEMPGMDGFTFIERIRMEPTLAQVPAILVTSRNAPEDRQRGVDVGAQGYIVKGEFDQGVLLDRIRTLVK